MSRFQPSNLLEAIAQQIAASKGYESADMVRREVDCAANILRIVGTELNRYLVHDEEDAVKFLSEAAEGRDYRNPLG